MVEESKKFVEGNEGTLVELVEFCIFDDETYDYFEKEFDAVI